MKDKQSSNNRGQAFATVKCALVVTPGTTAKYPAAKIFSAMLICKLSFPNIQAQFDLGF
jgi:hypothetical protein